MKSIFGLLAIITSLGLEAQNVFSPPPAGAAVTPPAGTTAGRAALSTSPSAAPGPFSQNSAMTNAFGGLGFTNQFGTNFTAGDLNSVLLVLQNELQQALSLLAGFNGNLAIAQGTVPSGNFSQNLGNSAGQNLGINLAQNVATPTGDVAAHIPPPVFAQPLVPPTTLAAQGPNTSGRVGATNNLSSSFAGSNSAQLLIILQNDMERMLPEIAALTGGAFILPGANGTFVTNQFGVSQLGTAADTSANTGTPRIPARRSTTTVPQTLTPTGRP